MSRRSVGRRSLDEAELAKRNPGFYEKFIFVNPSIGCDYRKLRYHHDCLLMS